MDPETGDELELIPATIRVFVNDGQAARAFYQDVLRLPFRDGSEQRGYFVFSLGTMSLVVEIADPNDPNGEDPVGRFIGFSFRVRDIHRAHRILVSRGVDFVGAPERQPWGGTLAHFRDPAGNVLTLVEYARREQA